MINLTKTKGTTNKELYVKVEYPEDTTFFEDNDIGNPCFESKDNGARYIKEKDYIDHFKKVPNPNQYFCIVQWPESQEYFEDSKLESYSETVEDEKGLNDFICPALWVPLCYLK